MLLRRLKKYTLYRKHKRDFFSFFYKKRKKDIASYVFLKAFTFKVQRKLLPFLKRLVFKAKRRPIFLKNTLFFTKVFSFKKFHTAPISRILNFLQEYNRFEWFTRFSWYSYYRISDAKLAQKKTKNLTRREILMKLFEPKIDYDFEVDFFRIKPFNFPKKRLAFWIKRRRLEFFTSLFYGFTSLKKFKKSQDKFFFKTRSTNRGLFFENSIYTFLFRLNVFKEYYTIKTAVTRGFIEVNEKKVLNPFFRFKLNDDISIAKKYFKKIYFSSKKNRRKLVNFPEYIVFNPIILCGSIWRNPFKHEICGFYDFRISRNFFGRSSSSSYYAK